MENNTSDTSSLLNDNDDHSHLFASVEDRTIRGLLLPFNELSQPSVSGAAPVMFSAGTVELPADASVVTANRDHDRHYPVGRAISVTETARGIEAEFAIGRTPEGDALLAEASNPDPAKRPRLSAEIRDFSRDGARAVRAVLTGAAFVPQGAFASAALFALAPEEPETEADLLERLAALEALVASLTTTDEAPAFEEEDTDSAPEEDEKKGDFQMENAVIPAGVGSPATPATDTTTASGLFSALATARRGGDRSALAQYAEAEGADFALGSIQRSGPSALTIGGDVETPAFLGELWRGKAYQRKFIPLVGSGALTSYKVNGWRWVEGKRPEVDLYAGNNAEVPSNAVDTEPYSVEAQRIAGAHRVDRKFIDFSDSGFWESYNRAMVESYARKSDKFVLDQIVAAATAVTPGTVPVGLPKALAAIVDGALAIIAQENTPSFAVVDAALWRDVVLNVGENNVLNYLTASAGLEDGTLSGFQIIPSALVGASKVLVGAREAVTNYELGGAPIRVEGLVPANGAIEPALYGYDAVVIHNAKALSLITVV